MKEYLIVVDMQKDFVDGALGTAEAVAIVPAVAERIRTHVEAGGAIAVTLDTHGDAYMQTQEGKNLPVPHCIKGTPGHELYSAVANALAGTDYRVFEKETFGSPALAQWIAEAAFRGEARSVTLIGLCTDICVISNAMLIKAFAPEVQVCVEAACCAGVTPESHDIALAAMGACQIAVV